MVAGHLAVHSWTYELEELLDGSRRVAVDSDQVGEDPVMFHGKWKVLVVLGDDDDDEQAGSQQ